MRSLVAAALFFLAVFIATVDTTPAPHLAVQALTPQQIIQEINREAKQKQYDAQAKIALIVFRGHKECNSLAQIVGEGAVEHHLPARVLAAMAIAESSCNSEAVSPTGDYGVWQINAKIWKQRPSILRDPTQNGRLASKILGAFVHQYGLIEGLHHYNGMGRPEGQYSSRVMTLAYGRAS
jgi:hypothetical protein